MELHPCYDPACTSLAQGEIPSSCELLQPGVLTLLLQAINAWVSERDDPSIPSLSPSDWQALQQIGNALSVSMSTVSSACCHAGYLLVFQCADLH